MLIAGDAIQFQFQYGGTCLIDMHLFKILVPYVSVNYSHPN